MQYRRLGRTGLEVSLVGLGTGGPSRLGQDSGVPEAGAIRLVRRALDLGINLIDTSAGYGDSELILGRALREVERRRYIIATKFRPREEKGEEAQPAALEESLHRSLRRLGVDCIDLFQFHGIQPELYEQVVDRYLGVAQRCQRQGKVRFLGITERYSSDGGHRMLRQALADDHFDSIMVGYNLLAPGAEHEILPAARKRDVGVLVMFAVRRALSDPERLQKAIAGLKQRGLLDAGAVPDQGPLDWLLRPGVESVTAAAYKFAAAHPAVSSVLTGTADRSHLEANIEAILGAALAREDRERIVALFGHVEECVVH